MPLAVSPLQQISAISAAQSTVAYGNTMPSASIVTAASPAEPLAAGTAFTATVSTFNDIKLVQASTNSISNASINTAKHRITNKPSITSHIPTALHGILESRLNQSKAERQLNNKAKTSAFDSSQDNLTLYTGKSEKRANLHAVNNQQVHFKALKAIVEKADLEDGLNFAQHSKFGKNMKQADAVDTVLADNDDLMGTII